MLRTAEVTRAVMPAQAGIQYSEMVRLTIKAGDYGIIRFRGR